MKMVRTMNWGALLLWVMAANLGVGSTSEAGETASSLRRVFLQPPALDPGVNVKTKIVCARPYREGGPRIGYERIGDQDIYHGYGHGSWGWTGLFGSVDSLVDYFLQGYDGEHHTSITIIGAGCMAKMTAIKLLSLGYENLTLMAASFTNLTSHNAGGLLSPSSSIMTSPHLQRICLDTYTQYLQVMAGTHPYFNPSNISACVREMAAFFPNREGSDLEFYVSAGLMSPAQDVIVDFGNGTSHRMVQYRDIFMGTQPMMAEMDTILRRQNVRLVEKTVTAFTDVGTPVIFNCTGAGARELCHDDAMRKIFGHLVLLQEQPSAREGSLSLRDYMILGPAREEEKEGYSNWRFLYYMPKQTVGADDQVDESQLGVMGGTFLKNTEELLHHPKEFDDVMKEALHFYGMQ
jgi:D-amino-acid oxidase